MIEFISSSDGHILTKLYSIHTSIHSSRLHNNDFPVATLGLSLGKYGWLHIAKGYEWDGATGYPDVIQIIRASLVHDALYDLIREGVLNKNHRKKADKLFRKICLEDGMGKWEAWRVYTAVRLWGWKAL
jgi:hypothetical protein